jgi:hypothetical protein
MRVPRCRVCGVSLPGPRLFVDWHWYCPDCAYELEYGPVERVRPEQPSKHRPQAETLFDLDEARSR